MATEILSKTENQLWNEKMTENKSIFPCCKDDPIFLITYSVAGEQKTYSVCKSCESLEYFKKYIIKKVPI